MIGINGNSNNLLEALSDLEAAEKDTCSLPLIFSEMFKNEINANDEHKMYKGIKRVVKKYMQNAEGINAIAEFTRVITGGASLDEIMMIARDEAVSPTLASEINVDQSCKPEC